MLAIAVSLAICLTNNANAQPVTFADTLNCINGTPTFIVDLTSSPSASWISTPQVRAGDCCGTDNNCVQFVVTLNPGAGQINFFIPGGCGAAPSGALFYQVGCGPLTSVGTPLCVTGVGPYVITFCKPGNNSNCYAVQSIPLPSIDPNIITTAGCSDSLSINGVVASSVVWNSIAPGASGQYNSYLSCTSGCLSTAVTPTLGSPSLISYQVCGLVISACGNYTYCDTVTVTVVPLLSVAITSPTPSICSGATGVWITAIPSGGNPPYSYLWGTGDTTQAYYATAIGSYFVTLGDATGCQFAYDTVNVIQFFIPMSANAGPDISVCASPVPTVTLDGSVTGTTTGIWLNGAGTFAPNNTTLNATYTPSAAELAAGFVNLSLVTTNTGSCDPDTDIVTITFLPFSAALSSTITPVSCFGGSNGAVNQTLTGGVSPFSYSWSSGQTTEDISALPIGTYTVTITDGNGCTTTAAYNITQPTLLTASSSVTSNYNGQNVSCFNSTNGTLGSTPGGGTPGYTYSWSTIPTQNTQNATGVGAGTYTVTITDLNGCTSTSSIIVTQPPLITAASNVTSNYNGEDVSCFNSSDGILSSTPGGGTPNYAYSWNTAPVQNVQNATGVGAGTYTVTIIDVNGCTATSSVTVTEPTQLTISSIIINVICFGQSTGAVDITVANGTPGYTYLWSNASINEDLNAMPTGTYIVTATDLNGCTITLENNVLQFPSPLNITSVVTNVSCLGLSDGIIDITVTGGVPVYSYSWSNGFVTDNISGLLAGTYFVTATDQNGCTITSAIDVTQPFALALSTIISNVSCYNGSNGIIDLSTTGGTPGYSYNWSNGPITQDISALIAGGYTVTVTDQNNCTTSNTYIVTEPLELIIIDSVLQNQCFGIADAAIFILPIGGTVPFQYSWDNGATTQNITNIIPGPYVITVTDNNGCVATGSYIIISAIPFVVSVLDTLHEIWIGESVSLYGIAIGGASGYTYLWTPPDFLNCTDCDDPTSTPFYDILYNFIVTDSNGCSDTAWTKILVKEELFVPNTITINDDNLNETFKVYTQILKKFTMKIYDRWGETIFTTNDYTVAWDGTHNGEECPQGVYVYRIDYEFYNKGKQKALIGHLNLLR